MSTILKKTVAAVALALLVPCTAAAAKYHKHPTAKPKPSAAAIECNAVAAVALTVRMISGVVTNQAEINRQSNLLTKQCLGNKPLPTVALQREIQEYRIAQSHSIFDQANETICQNYAAIQSGTFDMTKINEPEAQNKGCVLDPHQPEALTVTLFNIVRQIETASEMDVKKWREDQHEILLTVQERVCWNIVELYNDTRTDPYLYGKLTTYVPNEMSTMASLNLQCQTAPAHATDTLLKIMDVRTMSDDKSKVHDLNTKHDGTPRVSMAPLPPIESYKDLTSQGLRFSTEANLP